MKNYLWLSAIILSFAACTQAAPPVPPPVAPPIPPPVVPPVVVPVPPVVIPPKPLGLLEVKFSEINNAQPNSSAKNINSSSQNRGLNNQVGGIDLKLVNTSAFGFIPKVNREEGFRYFSATYKIRNADGTGKLYNTPRQNLSFIAVSTSSTIAGTAISNLLRSDGTNADAKIAALILPTHEMELNKTSLTPKIRAGGEDFQVFKENEIAGFQLGGINAIANLTSVFNYGFVVRRIGDSSNRTLPGTPTQADGYDGIVTFAMRIPLQADPDGIRQDPTSFSMMFEVMDDPQTRVTQSLEEQSTPNLVEARATALTGAQVQILPGSQAKNGTTICSVRTAGTIDKPLTYLVNSSSLSAKPVLANQMFAPLGAAVNVNFDQAMNTGNTSNFTLNGSMSGRKAGTYNGAGSSSLGFFPVNDMGAASKAGEEFEVTLSAGLSNQTNQSLCTPYTFRYRSKVGTSSNASFQARTSTPVGFYPHSVVAADFNHDAKLDLVTSDQASSAVSLMLGNGDGSFKTPVSYAAGDAPTAVVTADLNRDNNLDILTADPSSNTISVLLGNGDGTFKNRVALSFGSSLELAPQALVVSDLNSDGNLDIATANQASSTVSVFLGKGDGSFQKSIYYAVDTTAVSIAATDLNNDGKIDLVTSNDSAVGEVSVLLNNGDGSFQKAIVTRVSIFYPVSVTASDLNNDGNIDLVTTSRDSSAYIAVLLGNGDGSFQNPKFYQVGAGSSQVITADLNGDGKLDIATSDANTNELSVLLGNGNGTFDARKALSVGSYPSSLTAADFNGDGKLDLVSADSLANAVSVLLQP